MLPLQVIASTLVSALGAGTEATAQSLREQRTGLAPCRFETVELDTWVGQVPDLDAPSMPAGLERFECRNNRLALRALRTDGFENAVRAAIARHGASRIGVFIGTSTSGIFETELAYRNRDADGHLPAGFHYAGSHNTFSCTDFTRHYFGIEGPAMTVSAACASSAKVFGNAARMIEAGWIDAAIVGGVDTLCLTTLYGFNSLQLVAPGPCMPFAAERSGISIAEAAGFALVQAASPGRAEVANEDAIVVAGVGESSDAHHMSSPHPDGAGARAAMEEAIAQAGVTVADIDYVNLHGTGTPSNDAAEDAAVHALLGDQVPVSSTKGATGHTLGAAGILEALITAIAIRESFAPAGLNTPARDPALHTHYLLRNLPRRIDIALSNSFGFGGSNCTLLLMRGSRFEALGASASPAQGDAA